MTGVDAQVVTRANSRYDQRQVLNYVWPNYKGLSLATTITPQLQIIKMQIPKCNIRHTAGDHPNTAEDDFRQKFYLVLDTVISCIKDRFKHG